MEGDSERARVTGLTSISGMSRRYGLSRRTLRYYEQMALLTPLRVGTHRFYSKRDELRIELVLVGKRLGFSLREIDNLIQHYEKREQNMPIAIADLLDIETIDSKIIELEKQKYNIEQSLSELRTLFARM